MKTLDSTFWNKYFRVYDILNMVIPYQDLLHSCLDALQIKKGDKVLDAGSGTGNLSILIANVGGNVIALDSSSEGIFIHQSKQHDIVTKQGDLTKPLPFADNMFDKICSNNVIYTLPQSERKSIFKEFYRILKPGGLIVVSNITKEFSPFAIYIEHIKLGVKRYGILKTFLDIIRLMHPTMKIFYYNYLIKRADRSRKYSFMSKDEQRGLMGEVGFVNISQDMNVYANQAVLNSATKNKS